MSINKRITVTQARANLNGLIDEVNESHRPVHIAGKRGGAVLVGAQDWQAVQKTLYVFSVPESGCGHMQELSNLTPQ